MDRGGETSSSSSQEREYSIWSEIAAFHLHHVSNKRQETKVKARPKNIHLKGRALQFAMNLFKNLQDSYLDPSLNVVRG